MEARRGRRLARLCMIILLLTPVARLGTATAASSPLGKVRYIHRGLAVMPPHRNVSKGKVREPLFAAYGLRTGKFQRASVGFVDGTLLDIDQRTDAVLASASRTIVKKGQIDQVVTPGASHSVKTAEAVASAIGTNFDVRVKGKVTTIVVVEGAVLVTNAQGSVLVKTGQKTTIRKGQAPQAPTTVDALNVISWAGAIPPPASPVGLNAGLDANGGSIARSTSSRASSGQDLWNSKWIDDGRLDFGWASGAGQTTGQFVILSLPGSGTHSIRGVVIDPAATHGQPATDDLKDFEIRISVTNSSDSAFVTVFKGTTAASDTLQRFDLPLATQARYVELLALTNYGGTDGIDVAELEVVANEQVLAAPAHAHHLTGNWNDNGRAVTISQKGDALLALYKKPYVCDYRDGTGRKAQTFLDFRGTLDLNSIAGKTIVCSFGAGNPGGVGLTLTDIQLTASADDKTLKGVWYSEPSREKHPVLIRRVTG